MSSEADQTNTKEKSLLPGLYLVATPIGNLGDITFRAVDTLEKVDLILAEDTRTTGILLKHYDISTPQKSYHIHNEHKILDSLIEELRSGKTIALVSDAGSPSISDPGFLLVRECVKSQIDVYTIPGACAAIAGLQVSGLPSDRFVFEGFLPPKKGRTTRINKLAEEQRTIVLYESPHKIVKTLEQLSEALGPDRPATLIRELTKLYEEKIYSTLGELQMHFTDTKPKGEIVLCISGKTQ